MEFEPKLTQEQLDALELDGGDHSDPSQGHCLLEVVSMFAGESFSDKPQCVDPVLASFGIGWNDGMRSNEERAQLKKYIPLLPGTNKGKELGEVRAFMAMDWVIRVNTPAWLDLSPALAEHAATLRALAPITGQQTLEAALPALDKARGASSAARDAAYEAVQAMPKSEIVAEALEVLGYRAEVFPVKSFNDDDYYVYHPVTLEFKAHFSHRDGWRLQKVPVHLAADKGMHCKHMGIWRLVDLNRSQA